VFTDSEDHALRPASRSRELYTLFFTDEQGSVVGVDGCPAGWVCFHNDLQSRWTSVTVIRKLSEFTPGRAGSERYSRPISHPVSFVTLASQGVIGLLKKDLSRYLVESQLYFL